MFMARVHRGAGYSSVTGARDPRERVGLPDRHGSRPRARAAREAETGKRAAQPARLIEGQRVTGWREALNELAVTYLGRIG
jgi:hypothetical protein